MPLGRSRTQTEEHEHTWGGLPVTVYKGVFCRVSDLLPSFERRPFQTMGAPHTLTRANDRLKAIVRLPTAADSAEVPVGVVSRQYRLVQHQDVIKCLEEAFKVQRIDPAPLETLLSLTPNGERMALSILFPDEARFRYSINSGDDMGFRLECFNSVDGTMKFTMVMGWLRFVCSNGLVLGKTLAHVRRAHTPSLELGEVSDAIRRGVGKVEADRRQWDEWRSVALEFDALRDWVDSPLKAHWGAKAATRTFAVCMTGSDIELTNSFESALPSVRGFKEHRKVPGAPARAATVFDVAQALSWVAGQRRDLTASTQRVLDVESMVTMLIRTIHKRRN